MKGKLLTSIAFTLLNFFSLAQVAINTDGALPDNSAMLDVKSTTKGMLVPSMTATQRDAIANPATGLLIFCTDNNLFFSNKGTPVAPNWVIVSSQWVSGGSGIYFNGGNVGIGTIAPLQKLDIRGANSDEGSLISVGNSDLSHQLMFFSGRQNDPNPFVLWRNTDPLRFATDLNGFKELMRISPNGNVGIGTSSPVAILDVAGGNNWDVVNGEGDFRIGNSQYRLRMGVALSGGGAGATGIMQYGQPGAYNVLSLGAQGNKLLYLNGESLSVGIGTDTPQATLDVRGTLSIVDGTQGYGKFLTSDADGLATWGFPTYYIGLFPDLGGYVFYVTPDGKHGLVAATQDQISSVNWYDAVDAISKPTSHDNDGKKFTDWRLPTKYEIDLMYQARLAIGGFSLTSSYWSRSEGSSTNALQEAFGSGGFVNASKSSAAAARAIRSF